MKIHKSSDDLTTTMEDDYPQACGNFVCIEQKSSDRKSDGGIFYPEQSQHLLQEGWIVSLGDKVKEFKQEDYVYFGNQIHLKKYVVVHQDNILAKRRKT